MTTGVMMTPFIEIRSRQRNWVLGLLSNLNTRWDQLIQVEITNGMYTGEKVPLEINV